VLSIILCELRRHLRSYRLLVLYGGGLALMVAATLICAAQTQDQRSAWLRFSQEAERSANLDGVALPRPPATLGFLRAVPREQWREATVLRPHLVDGSGADVSERSWQSAAEPFDWSAVAIFFFGLMAIVLAYDSVAGEKAGGTLRVVLGRPVGRLEFLVGKILAAFLVVGAAFVMAALAALAVAVLGGAPLNGSHYAVLALAVGETLLFLLFNVLLGVAASVSAPAPGRALQRALGVWTLLAFALPGAVVVLGSRLRPVDTELEFQRNIALHEQSYWSRLSVSSPQLSRIVNLPGVGVVEKRKRIADLEAEMWVDQEIALAEMEEAYADLRREHLLQAVTQENWIDRWSALSPYALLRRSLDRLALTGTSGGAEFRRQAEQFEPVFTSFVLDQRRMKRDEAREGTARAIVTDNDGERYELRALAGLDYSEVAGPFEGYPRFEWRPPPVALLAEQALPDLAWMLGFVVAASGYAFLRFQRYDCR